MIESVARHGGDIDCCGTCLDARRIEENRLTRGARRSSLDELAAWIVWADKVVTYQSRAQLGVSPRPTA